jgi:hypothetical protein
MVHLPVKDLDQQIRSPRKRKAGFIAFSSEVAAGSREENASIKRYGDRRLNLQQPLHPRG